MNEDRLPVNVPAMNVQDRLFLELWAETGFDKGRRSECMRSAGYKGTARTPRSVREYLVDQMNKKGLSITNLIEVHAEGLKAVDPKFLRPDYATRHKYMETGYRLHDVNPNPKIEVEKRSFSVSLSMDTLMTAERISGEKIIDLIPEGSIEKDESREFIKEGPEEEEVGGEIRGPLD